MCEIVRTGSGPYNKCSISITFKQEFPEVTLFLPYYLNGALPYILRAPGLTLSLQTRGDGPFHCFHAGLSYVRR